MKHADKIELIEIEKLIPYARNSRTHSDEQVAQIAGSIREFGFTNPVLINKDGTIVAGHGRVMAARKLKMESVPCLRLGHLTESQVRAYVIADNKLALNAGWDEEMLRIELQSLKEEGADMALTGFCEQEIETILGILEVSAAEPPEDFPEAGEDISTDHQCPKCGYQWSGKIK
jgi:ParB-like chromosome segregation protein Spo0J